MKKLFTVTFTEQDNWHIPTIFLVNATTKEKAYEIGLQKIGKTKEEMEVLYNKATDHEGEFWHIEEEIKVIEEEYIGNKDLNNLYSIPIKHTITKYYDVCLTENPKSISNYLINILENNELFLADIKDNNLGPFEKYFSDSNLITKEEYNKFRDAFEFSYYFEENDLEELRVVYPDDVYSFFNVENSEDYCFKVFNIKTKSFLPDSYNTNDYQKLLLSILTDYLYSNYFGIFEISIFEFGGIVLQVVGDWSLLYFEKSDNIFNVVNDDSKIETILKSNVSKYPEILKYKNELSSVYSFYQSLLIDMNYENIINCFNSNENMIFKDYEIFISDDEFNDVKVDFKGNESSIKYIGKVF